MHQWTQTHHPLENAFQIPNSRISSEHIESSIGKLADLAMLWDTWEIENNVQYSADQASHFMP